MYFRYLEASLGEGAGLVENYGIDAGNGFETIASLEENTCLGGDADSAEVS